MWLPVVGSFYLCFKIRESKQRVAATAGTTCLCSNTIYSLNLRKAQHSYRTIMGRGKKKGKKSTSLSELMNNDTTKEIRSATGDRNTQV